MIWLPRSVCSHKYALTSDISQTGDDERDILLPILFISAKDENEE